MDRDPSKCIEEQSERYLQTTGRGYVLNEFTGLYEHKAALTELHRNQRHAGTHMRTPFFVHALRDWVTVGISMLTLIGLVFTVYYTEKQWIEANRNARAAELSACAAQQQVAKAQIAIDQARDQFTKDERPYLAQTVNSSEQPQPLTNPLTPDLVQVTWNWHMTNYGKSPASDVRMSQEMRLGNGSFEPSFGANGKKGGKAYDIGASEPPGGSSFDTVISKPIKKAEYEDLLRSEKGIAFRVHISYKGLDGTPYETAICLQKTNVGSLAYCKNENYIK